MMPAREIPVRITLDWLLQGLVECQPPFGLEVSGLSHDSRAIKPGDLFLALAGRRFHGISHGSQAIAAGACAILFDPAGVGYSLAEQIVEVPCYPVPGLDRMMGHIAARFFGEPSASLDVTAITGTNGKTSCSHFLSNVASVGRPGAVVGTLGWGVPGALQVTEHTTPDAIQVHDILDRLRGQGIATVAMEASSHGLEQGRLNGVRFKGGVFTNLSRDHLDYHGTMEAYLEAKLLLLEWPGLQFMVFNRDDAAADVIIRRTPLDVRLLGFSRHAGAPVTLPVDTVFASDVRHTEHGIAFTASYRDQRAPVFAPVFGDFNVENLLATLAVLLVQDLDLTQAAELLQRVRPVPGRMEHFFDPRGVAVIVDYAHTPDALATALASLRQHCQGQLWVVFGCGGDRDRGKRPQMARSAEQLADQVIVTDDNPRHEDGDQIVADLLRGFQRGTPKIIRDRRDAIAFALEQAVAGDVVLVAGKGHENTQDIAGVKHPFSDRDTIHSLLRPRSLGNQ